MGSLNSSAKGFVNFRRRRVICKTQNVVGVKMIHYAPRFDLRDYDLEAHVRGALRLLLLSATITSGLRVALSASNAPTFFATVFASAGLRTTRTLLVAGIHCVLLGFTPTA